MNLKKLALIATITLSSLLTLSFVSAQYQGPDAEYTQHARKGRGGMGPQHGGSGFLPLRGLNEGSTVSVNFYDADPSTGALATDSNSLTIGQDSESAFMRWFQEASANAAFAQVSVSAQTHTIELDAEQSRRGHGRASLGFGPGPRLNDGSTVMVSFYDGNPDEGAALLQTLSFVNGQDSETAFHNALEAAAETATWAQVNVSAQEHTIDLSERPMGPKGFGRQGPAAPNN